MARQLGVGVESLRSWVKQAEIDGGVRPGTTTEERRRIAELERENRELRRSNEILKAAASFFAREFDPRLPKMMSFIDENKSRFGVEPICGTCRSPPPRTTPPGPARRLPGRWPTRS